MISNSKNDVKESVPKKMCVIWKWITFDNRKQQQKQTFLLKIYLKKKKILIKAK